MSRTIIFSDLHLGSDTCQVEELTKFFHYISETKIDEVIINGDIFDSFDFRRMQDHHWKILSKIIKMSHKMKVTLIEGNHDIPGEIIFNLFGNVMLKKYIFSSGGKKIMVLHGHQFDTFITKHPILTSIADFFYYIIQKIDKTYWLARQIKKTSKTFLRCAENVSKKAIKLANKNKCDVVCCGHTHAVQNIFGKIEYYNSGCWTEPNGTYLEIVNGIVCVKKYGLV